MGEEEKINELFEEELQKCMGDEKVINLPITIKVEQDEMPDIERWIAHE